MIFREATNNDIEKMHAVRIAVTENPLPDPEMISPAEYDQFINFRGKGWVCESGNIVFGFAIVDLMKNNVWALFVHPGFEHKGIGKRLHDVMLNWYFTQTNQTIWLGTAPKTRAENFYRKAGWRETGKRLNGEIKFEMSLEDWKSKF